MSGHYACTVWEVNAQLWEVIWRLFMFLVWQTYSRGFRINDAYVQHDDPGGSSDGGSYEAPIEAPDLGTTMVAAAM